MILQKVRFGSAEPLLRFGKCTGSAKPQKWRPNLKSICSLLEKQTLGLLSIPFYGVDLRSLMLLLQSGYLRIFFLFASIALYLFQLFL